MKLIEFIQRHFGHYIKGELGIIHKAFLGLIKDLLKPRIQSRRYVIMAPRGYGKSTFFSLILPILAIGWRLKQYILIISGTESQAKDLIKNIKREMDTWGLEFFKLRRGYTYGVLELDFYPTGRIQGLSWKAELRGRREGERRPDLIILDDVETDKVSASRRLQDELYNWYVSTVIPAGDVNADFLIVGTTLNKNSLVLRLAKTGQYKVVKYGAWVSPPNLELWEALIEEAYQNGYEKAKKFYLKHKEQLESSLILSWKERDIIWLLEKFLLLGRRSFMAEYFNQPMSTDDMVFKVDEYTTFDKTLVKLEDFEFWIAVDPSTGKHKRVDYTGIAVVGRNKNDKRLYVFEAIGTKESINSYLKRIEQLVKLYNPKILFIEANAFQYVLKEMLLPLSEKYGVLIKGITSHKRKEERILRLQPMLESGQLILPKYAPLLFDQMEQFPNCEHDDVLDALAMCAENLPKNNLFIKIIKGGSGYA